MTTNTDSHAVVTGYHANYRTDLEAERRAWTRWIASLHSSFRKEAERRCTWVPDR